MESTDWELSKENIQPLRSGRKASTLANAGGLTPCRSKELQEEKNKFEAALRTNQGEDPLEPWTSYINWVEQNYPKGGKEGNLSVLLEKCIKEFNDDKIYSQDERYLHVWIKYASMAQKPLDLYNFMHNSNLCTKLPEFYINWAWYLEESGNYKKAEQAFKTGVEMVDRTDHKFELMETKHRQFQARVMKRMVNTSEISNTSQPPSGEEERAVLGSLQGHGKHQKVGSMRIGTAKKSNQPGALPLTSHNPPPQQNKHGFAIFQDDEYKEPTLNQHSTSTTNSFPFAKEQNRENELNAGKWSKSNFGRKGHAVPLDRIDAAPQFAVHQDEGLEQPEGPTPHRIQPGESSVLSARKATNDEDDQRDVAVALFEPLDPTKRAMYCKHLVYQGTTEFSFEEIRGARWKKRQEEQELKLKQEEMSERMQQMEVERIKMEAERNTMRKQQEEIKREQEKLRKMHESAMRQQQDAMRKQQDDIIRQQEEFRKLKEDMEKQMRQAHRTEPKSNNNSSTNSNIAKSTIFQSTNSGILSSEISSQSRETSTNPSNLQRSSSFLDDTRALLGNPLASSQPSTGDSNPNSLHKTPPRLDVNPALTSNHSGFQLQRQMSQPSPTVNTKEAQMLMQEMWGSQYQSGSKLAKEEFIETNLSQNSAPFSIYQDGEDRKPEKKSKKPLPIPIFCDEENSQPQNTSRKAKATPLSCRQSDIDKHFGVTIKHNSTTDDKENVLPTSEQYSQHKVPTNGPLLPSEHVVYAPLEIQEKVLDDDEQEQELAIENEEKLTQLSSARVPERVNQNAIDSSIIQSHTLSNPNQTMFLPSAEDFEEMAKCISTPASGRRFIPEEDENTCAVQLAFKKPFPVFQEEPHESPEIIEGKANMEGFGLETKTNPLIFKSKDYASVENVGTYNAEFMNTKNREEPEQRYVAVPQSSDRINVGSDHTLPNSVPENQMNLMSPIMETSREYNYKSSSSSNESQWQMTATNKSHWNGNNTTSGPQQTNANTVNTMPGSTRTPGSTLLSKSTFSKSKTLGQVAGEMTCSSGYIADASSTRTPGIFLHATQNREKRKPISDNARNLIAVHNDKEEDDEEPTGFFGIMSEFQKGAGLLPAANITSTGDVPKSTQKDKMRQNQFLQGESFNQSLQGCNTTDVSRLAGGDATPLRMKTPSMKPSFLETSLMNDVSLNSSKMTAPIMFSNNTGLLGPSLELTQASPKMDISEPELELTRNSTHVDELGMHYNPLDTSIHRQLLIDLKIPVAHRHGYYSLNSNVPQIRANSVAQIGPTPFNIKECKGEGAYGKVFRASRPREDINPNETIAEMDSVLKIQKPQPNEWEFYICTELPQRLRSKEDKQWFMSIPRCYVFNDGSIFVSEHQPFTLLDVCNKVGSLGDMSCRELLAAYFTIEMLHVLEKLQKARIIHADIKPENFMIQDMPSLDENSKDSYRLFKNLKASLILIDFGVSIDMALLPKNAKFNYKFEKAENMTTEMIENKPWNYQIDYFGIANIAHTILYGGYMKLTKNNGRYETIAKPKRWWDISLWKSFFDNFLNIRDCESLPDVVQQRTSFELFFFKKYKDKFPKIFNDLKNNLYRK